MSDGWDFDESQHTVYERARERVHSVQDDETYRIVNTSISEFIGTHFRVSLILLGLLVIPAA